MATNILLVEDDAETAGSISRALESGGYRVTIAETGSEARSTVEHLHPDLILLDLMLPDTDGLVLTTVLKTLTSAPIIICSARHEQVDRVLGLKLGADDFIAKPFELDELEARIEAVLRRASRVREAPAAPTDQIRVDDLLISQSRGTVILAGQSVHLTPTEYRLLIALASRPGAVLSRETLGQVVWGYEDMGTAHLIDVHIGRLRLKLRRASGSGPLIMTVRGKGYTIGMEPTSEPGDERTDEEPRSRLG
ncbi:MAG: response regulator transcription factor [Chloroflexota bacterium]|nr:response regulator transcription factor [Chloroflexota bacterium]